MPERTDGSRSRALGLALWLGWMEVRRSAFGLRAPDSRDFRELILFLSLLSLFVSLMLSVQAGLLDRLADSFLGKVDEAGFPLVAMAGLNTLEKIDRSVLAAFKPPGSNDAGSGSGEAGVLKVPPALPTLGLSAHPFRILYGDEQVFGFKPAPDAEAAWQPRLRGQRTPFDGWAVLTDSDPLWTWAMARLEKPDSVETHFPESPPLILNLAAFEHLDYATYRNTLLGALPEPLVDDTAPDFTVDPDTGAADPGDLRSLEVLWLWESVRPGEPRAIPFRAHWVDRFPAIDSIAYLVPASVVAALEQAARWPDFELFPEQGPGGGRRIAMLQLFPSPGETPTWDAALASLAACLSPVAERLPGTLPQWRFDRPQPPALVDACLAAAGLPEAAGGVGTTTGADAGVPAAALSGPVRAVRMETVAGTPYGLEPPGYLDVPCAVVGTTSAGLFSGCDGSQAEWGRVDFLTGFDGATTYTRWRDRLRETRDALLGLRRADSQVFWIAPSYERALDRFHFIEGVLSAARMPLIIVGSVFTLFLLLFFLGVLVAHRRRTYALMLAHGLDASAVRIAVAMQVMVAAAIGIPLGFLGAALVRGAMTWSGADADVQRLARETLGTDGVEIMPTPDPALLGWSAAALAVLSMTLLLVRLAALPLRNGTEPTELLR